jgi:peptidoglycan/LPS O-acetylase OafA/YrhL
METVFAATVRWLCLLIVAGSLVAGWRNHSPEMLVVGSIYATACLILARLDMKPRPDSGERRSWHP